MADYGGMKSRVYFRGYESWKKMERIIIDELTRPQSDTLKGMSDITIDGIIERTKRGIDVAGMTFEPSKVDGRDINLVKSGKLMSKEGFAFEVMRGVNKLYLRIYMTDSGHSKGISFVDLGRVHNFGLKSGRGKGFQMPKREFMGADQKIIDALINYEKQEWADLFRRLG